MTASKELILGTISDLVLDFLVYDRKNNEDLPLGAIEEAVEAGRVTHGEMVDQFAEMLAQGLLP